MTQQNDSFTQVMNNFNKSMQEMGKTMRQALGAQENEPEDVVMFREITEQMLDTYIAKNADYGSSVEDLYNEFGEVSLAVRLSDKVNRFKSIIKKGVQKVKDETIIDTLLDLANYAIISIILIRKKQGKRRRRSKY